MRQGHPFKVMTPDVEPGFCPICAGRIDPSSVHVAEGWVDLDCGACGEVRLDLTKHREGRGFAEHLETVLSQYDRSSVVGPDGGRSLEDDQGSNAVEASSFRRRMSGFIVARRATIAGGGRLAVSGSFEPSGTGRIEVGGLPGITTFDLIYEGGRPPSVTP